MLLRESLKCGILFNFQVGQMQKGFSGSHWFDSAAESNSGPRLSPNAKQSLLMTCVSSNQGHATRSFGLLMISPFSHSLHDSLHSFFLVVCFSATEKCNKGDASACRLLCILKSRLFRVRFLLVIVKEIR